MPLYQSLKLVLSDVTGLSRDGFHIILGFVVFILIIYLLKIKLSSWKALIAPLLFALVLETLDTRDALAFGFRVDIVDSLRDIIITTALPLLTILYARFGKARNTAKDL